MSSPVSEPSGVSSSALYFGNGSSYGPIPPRDMSEYQQGPHPEEDVNWPSVSNRQSWIVFEMIWLVYCF